MLSMVYSCNQKVSASAHRQTSPLQTPHPQELALLFIVNILYGSCSCSLIHFLVDEP